MENGVHAGLLVGLAAGVTPQQAREFKSIFNEDNAGPLKAGGTKVMGGGATVTQIGMSQRDAQFVEAGLMTLLDVGNIFDVPFRVVGADQKTEAAAKPEYEDTRWFNDGLTPRGFRIEAALYADPDLFGPGCPVYPGFDYEGVVTGDVATMDTIYHNRIQDGRLLPDEYRLAHGQPPIPPQNADTPPGMIAQITPVGGAPNPFASTPNPAAAPAPTDAKE